MFFKTTISGINNNTSLFRLNDDSLTEYIFNVKHISDIVDYGGGSRFSIVNNYDSRWSPTVITCSTSQSDVISTFDNVTMSDVYTASCFKDNDITKDAPAKDILTENIVLIYSHYNPSYSWLIYDNGYRLTKVLVNDTLDDILFLLMVVSADYLVLTSQGDGTGVTTVKFEVSDNVILSLSGTARFYSDAAGTLDESATWTITPGALRTYYLKCPSGTANLYFSDILKIIKWGNASTSGWDSSTNAASVSGDLGQFINIIECFLLGNCTFSNNISTLPSGLTTCRIGGSNTITGDVINIPSGMTYFSIFGNNTIFGNLNSITATITTLRLGGFNTVGGDLSSLPTGLTYLYIVGSGNIITGNLNILPLGLTYFEVGGSNIITGDLSSIPPNVTVFGVSGNNTISGNINSLPINLTVLSILGTNIVTGDISTLPGLLTYILLGGSNTVSGDISDLPVGMTFINFAGSNNVNDYTAGRIWTSLDTVYISPTIGMSTAEVDNLLIDMSAATWLDSKILWLAGNNAARSGDSDAAVLVLQGQGVVVTTN